MSYIGGGHRQMAVGGPSARLEELLEQIRHTFESVSQDVEHSKSQHNDYERRGCISFQRRLLMSSVCSNSRNKYYSESNLRTWKGICSNQRIVSIAYLFILTCLAKRRRLLDCVVKKPSWRERHLQVFRPVHHPQLLDLDPDYYSLNLLLVFGRTNLHRYMIHISTVADTRTPIKAQNVADKMIHMVDVMSLVFILV